ncbi:hypothetical protein HYX12_01320 [Candidatus Woesearchaeota archaeon]|nr:hypothetical protein [Candidatus Woesearchaeota archaeon]
MKNVDVAKILNHIADILEFQDIPWKPLAYRKAAQVIESLTEDVEQIYHQGKLTEIPGIGESIAEKIEEMIQTGNLRYYEKLKKEVKVNLEELNQVPNLGPKRIKLLYTHLNIKDIADLEKAIEQRTLRKIPGFGEESEKKLLEGIHFVKTKPKRFLYAHAKPIVLDVLSLLKKLLFVKKVEVAGSFRRGKETVGDLDFLAVSSNSSEVMQAFVNLPDRQEILAQGGTKASIRLKNGLQIDLRVVREKEFGSAMKGMWNIP